MLRDINAVAFGILDPALGDRSISVGFGGGVGNFFDRFDTIDLETEVMNAPGIFVRVNQSEIHMAVGQINRPAWPPMLFFHAKNSLVVLRGFVEILDVDGDMSDTWFFHEILL